MSTNPEVDPPNTVPVEQDVAEDGGALMRPKPAPIVTTPQGLTGGTLMPPKDNVVFAPDTPQNRMEAGIVARFPLGGSIKTYLKGPADQLYFWFGIVSEIIVGVIWAVAGSAAGIGTEVMAVIVLGVWVLSNRNSNTKHGNNSKQ